MDTFSTPTTSNIAQSGLPREVTARRLFESTSEGKFVPILPATQLVPGAANQLPPVIRTEVTAKRVSKYSPPDFIPTVIFMRNKLFEIAKRVTGEDQRETPDDKATLAQWNLELTRESWYSNENVSACSKFLL